MGVIYLDSCVLIYAVERDDLQGRTVRRRMAESGETFAISPLVRLECLVGALRSNEVDLYHSYLRSFGQLESVQLNDDIFVSAAHLRVNHRLKSPDALHLAAAIAGGCSALWTNDDRLQAAAGEFAENVVR